MSRFAIWLQAARPLAQANIALPLAVGAALAASRLGTLNVPALLLTFAFGLFDHLFIVFANDVADEEGDRRNERATFFSGGSRVLPRGALDAVALRRAAMAMAFGMAAVALWAAFVAARPGALIAAGLAALLLWAYSYPPLRLSYRGYGEIAQGIGIGVVLVAFAYYMQVGSLDGLAPEAFVPVVLFGFAGNIVTALPDEAADRGVEKASWPVRFGLVRSRKHALQLSALAIVTAPFVLPDTLDRMWLAAVEIVPLAVLAVAALTWRSAAADDRAGLVRFVLLCVGAVELAMLGWVALLGAWGASLVS